MFEQSVQGTRKYLPMLVERKMLRVSLKIKNKSRKVYNFHL